MSKGNSKQSYQWFKDLAIEEAWSQFDEYGDKATVAILDTGCDLNNSDLPVPVASKLLVQTAAAAATVQDKVGHGTFCTSVIAARNQTVNIGIAPQCNTLIGKISLKGELLDFNYILNGIEWAIRSGADIISVSMGIPAKDQAQINQIQQRYDQMISGQNVLVLASCGDSDSGQIINNEFYPASLDNCVSIGTVQNNQLHNITVRSDKTVIHTLGIDIEGYWLNNAIEKQSGTSMSAPIIAGVLALAVSMVKKKNNGQWNKHELLQNLILTGTAMNAFPKRKIMDPIKFLQSL